MVPHPKACLGLARSACGNLSSTYDPRLTQQSLAALQVVYCNVSNRTVRRGKKCCLLHEGQHYVEEIPEKLA